jgi:acetylornithine deacetylase/succinyl-diaminopimelate desuccinylase-like protein
VAGTVRAPGLGVARGPAAAALVGFARAATALARQPDGYGLRLLLAARGTHRAADWDHPGADAPPTTGVSSFLARNSRPGAAVVAKGGPDGVLYDEPGASYLRVRARAPWGAVMSRGALRPEGGVLAHLGVLTDAVEVAGAALAAAAPTSAQAGAQFGIGAVRSGQPGKPDLVPGLVDLYCYFVSPGELTPGRAADALAGRTRALLAGTVLADVEVTVVEQVVHGGASTDAQAPVVRAAVAAYREVHDCVPPAVSGWTGSTDGIVLRAAGVPTVRVGPWRTVALGDGSDVGAVDDLVALVRVYERIARTLGPRAPMSHLT